ncbi:MAG: C4-type zinc ribbon domain-containing protein [Actinomycetota bacterium]|nr:C4-type zinc ribbon domain-containing protein [Actinomycetota bacterium]
MPDPTPTRAELEALLALQAAENDIRRLRRRLDELPEQAELAAATHAASSARAEQDARRIDLDLVESEMRRLEGEVGLLQQRRDAERSRLYGGGISQPRELQSLRAEVDNVERRIAALEDSLLEVMERREELAGEVEALGNRHEQQRKEQERLTLARDEAAQGILADLAVAETELDTLRGQVPDHVLERYDVSRRRHGRVGVGALEKGICTACWLELTPLEISDLRNAGPLGTCPQCQRLLVVLD